MRGNGVKCEEGATGRRARPVDGAVSVHELDACSHPVVLEV